MEFQPHVNANTDMNMLTRRICLYARYKKVKKNKKSQCPSQKIFLVVTSCPLKKSFPSFLAVHKSAGVAPEANFIVPCLNQSMNKRTHSGFQIHRRHDQKSETGASMAVKNIQH